VVPSLESYLFTSIVANQWKIDKALLSKKYSGKRAIQKWNNIKQGNADIDNVPTKHYLKEELTLLLAHEGFIIEDFSKNRIRMEYRIYQTSIVLKKTKTMGLDGNCKKEINHFTSLNQLNSLRNLYFLTSYLMLSTSLFPTCGKFLQFCIVSKADIYEFKPPPWKQILK
jgi:hypothetical protein